MIYRPSDALMITIESSKGLKAILSTVILFVSPSFELLKSESSGGQD